MEDLFNKQTSNIAKIKSDIDFIHIDEIVDKIIGHRICILGVGKNENLAIHFASLLKSVNISAVSLSVMNLLQMA